MNKYLKNMIPMILITGTIAIGTVITVNTMALAEMSSKEVSQSEINQLKRRVMPGAVFADDTDKNDSSNSNDDTIVSTSRNTSVRKSVTAADIISAMKNEEGAIKLPEVGMSGWNIGSTDLGEPHEILKAKSPMHFNSKTQYDAKWYFEDDKYDYRCTANVFSLDSGGEVVRKFSIYADPKGTYKYGKLYSHEYYYKRNRKTGKIVRYLEQYTNDFTGLKYERDIKEEY